MMWHKIFCFLFLIPGIANAYIYDEKDKLSIGENNRVVVTDVDRPINWSLAALSGVLRFLYGHHCNVSESELVGLSDYIFRENPTATMKDIAEYCKKMPEPSLSPVLFYYETKNGPCPTDGVNVSGFFQKSGSAVAKTSCQYFLELLIDQQNKYVGKFGGVVDGRPGFYVEKVSDQDGGIYQIVDFINSDDIEQASSIWEINHDGKSDIKKLNGFSTDIIPDENGNSVPAFVNILTTGKTRGIHEKSYIFPKVDLTEQIMNACRMENKVRGLEIGRDVFLFHPQNALDVKSTFCEPANTRVGEAIDENIFGGPIINLRMPGQTVTECHTNGVLFNGKVVTLQWLGHFLYGCKRGLASSGGENERIWNRYSNVAVTAQGLTNKGNDAQASDDGVFKNVQNIGSEAAKPMLFFKEKITSSPDEAIELVKQHMVKEGIIENKYNIRKCTTSGCDKKPAYVMCQVAGTNQYYQYEFKDICYSVQYIKYNSLG